MKDKGMSIRGISKELGLSRAVVHRATRSAGINQPQM